MESGGSDFNCDFNAPMFVDFTALDNENDHADAEAYFEVNHEFAENNAEGGEIPTEFEKERQTVDLKEVEQPKQDKRPKNLVTSWGPSSSTSSSSTTSLKSQATTDSDTPTRKALRQAVKDTIREITNSPKLKIPEKGKVGRGSPVKRLNAGKPMPLPVKKPTSGVEKKPSFKAEPEKKVSKAGSAASSPAMSRWRKAIHQMTPEIMRQARTKRLQKESEQKLLKDPVAIKAQLSKTRTTSLYRPVAASSLTKPTAASAGKAAAAAVPVVPVAKPMAASRPLAPTQPVPFSFDTDRRNKTSKEPVKGSEDVDFAKMLRSYQQHSTNKGTPVCTEVQPFNLTAGGRSRSASRDRGTTPTTSRSGSNERLTPTTRPRRFRSASPTPSPWRPTMAQTPNLVTRGRARGPDPNIMSAAQREEMEVRGRQPFRANPVPKISSKPVGVPQLAAAKPVIPESPAFALKHRMESRKRSQQDSSEKEPEPKRIIYAKPVPQRSGVPVILPNFSKKSTKVAPFSFDSRDAATLERKELKIQALVEEEKRLREFKAKPVPSTSSAGGPLPEVPVREATRPQPFDFEIEKRVGERLTKWEEAVEQDLQRQREAANFRAKPAAILEREPFKPKPCEKSLLVSDDFQLHSDRRAAERQQFDEKIRQREAEQDALKKRMEQLREVEREEEISRLRREAVHKAQPIKQYKPIHIVPSEKPITDARSPNWSHKRKN